MEPDTIFSVGPAFNVVARSWPQRSRHAAEPPTARMVIERLSDSLSIPVRGARDDAHRHDPSLQGAYQTCSEVIRKHSKSFYFSSRLLPRQKRLGIMALYAFCRISDDLVDSADLEDDRDHSRQAARASLDAWSEVARRGTGATGDPVALAWTDTRTRYGIPLELADELLSGVRMDLSIDRYETWDDLWLYCYRVASTVGLMSMYITGTETMEAVPYAVQLGVALQLTNILRDVGEDARAGRVYLPAEDMERFGYSHDKAREGVVDRSFIALMEFQVARAHSLYQAALPGVAHLPHDSRVAVMAAARLYRGILSKIVEARYDVFSRRAHLSTGEKLRTLPEIWWKARTVKSEGSINAPALNPISGGGATTNQE